MKLIQFFADNGSYILQKVGEHLFLAGAAVLLACLVGIPVGFLITNNKKVATIVVGIANTIQTIPSLALFAFAISVFGIGADNAIFALFLYALLPIIKNTLIGIRNVSPTMIEAARGMGMSRAQIMFQVEVPLAISVIMGGVRIATVTAIGIATIATLIGAGGLGQLIYQGIGMMNYEMIFAGAICSAALALLADFLLGIVEKRLTSKGLSRHMNRAKTL